MKITEELNKTTLTSYPTTMWIGGGFFFLIGVFFMIMAYGTFIANRADKPITSWSLVIFVFGLSALAIFAVGLLVISASIKKTIIDRTMRMVEFRESGLITKNVSRLAFTDIKEFIVVHETNSDDDNFYGLGMILKNDKQQKLSEMWQMSPDKKFRYEQIVNQLNKQIA